MRRLLSLIKNPIGFFLATILTGILIANLFGFNASALFLQFVGVITALVSIESTRRQLGAEGILRAFAKQLEELKDLTFQSKKRPRQTADIMEKVNAGGMLLGIKQVVVNDVNSPTLLSLKKDVKRLSDNQKIIQQLITEETKKTDSYFNALMGVVGSDSNDIREKLIMIHVKGSEFTVAGVILSFIGAIFSSWS
jgi:uncharacterized membrane protein YeaQ/YmgE (transglycosylase-associated protein family)